MTNLFKEKLGQVGYGYVYKEKLHGHLMIVKLLSKLKGDGEEFTKPKGLVSEYMPVGSMKKLVETQIFADF
ncbi:hypothetical protein EUGRSUZ_L00568 [Eucalyptus grandis]|uniref:Serine-threonine/tyrosine-protein kinase catalytic domain-containing protein n=1 Tax=Eucalyptus grandis TaxID=71139 RepID=A0A058ZV59_EUCGR|nr:hypothetical protein EUGRSUZ_L00568 [Eucalyptus grandis]